MSGSTQSKLAFFRQTGWMVMATGLGGVCMWVVHIPAQSRMTEAEYGVFLALLQVLNLMLIPAIGLQTIFAQQTAAAIAPEQQRQLTFTVRWALAGTFILWCGMALAAFLVRGELLEKLKIAHAGALWATVGIGLAMLWWPILQGVLQGRQDFLWLGWLQILNGGVRLGGVLVLVWWLGNYAAGAMTAALMAYVVCVAFAGWHSRSAWLGKGEAVRWREWFGIVVPLTLGLSAGQFMMAADQIVVQSVFDKEVTAFYGAPGTIGRALIFFTAALVAVMFPKVVRSVALSQRTDVVAQALGATALVGAAAALVCTLFPELPLRLVYKPRYWVSAPLVPWFVWSMLPLTLANVLITSLLARRRFACVPWLLFVSLAYGVTLVLRANSHAKAAHGGAFGSEHLIAFKAVVQTIGLFSALLLGVAAWFTWGGGRNTRGTAA